MTIRGSTIIKFQLLLCCSRKRRILFCILFFISFFIPGALGWDLGTHTSYNFFTWRFLLWLMEKLDCWNDERGKMEPAALVFTFCTSPIRKKKLCFCGFFFNPPTENFPFLPGRGFVRKGTSSLNPAGGKK